MISGAHGKQEKANTAIVMLGALEGRGIPGETGQGWLEKKAYFTSVLAPAQ